MAFLIPFRGYGRAVGRLRGNIRTNCALGVWSEAAFAFFCRQSQSMRRPEIMQADPVARVGAFCVQVFRNLKMGSLGRFN